LDSQPITRSDGNTRRPDGLERLNGLIERVTFHSPESGFAVLRVKVRGERELLTVVGTAPSVTAGEWIDAYGRWVVNSEHGQQFSAKSLRTTAPNTPEGVERYLGSGLIKGIGPKIAERLVQAFGVKVFDIIQDSSERLQEVDGIGPTRRERITQAWEEQRAIREIMVFLHSHGVSTSRAFRIYKTYGDEAIEVVRVNPYRLAQEVWGIGFKTADQIAEKLEIDKHSEIRARAGVEYVLQTLTEEGHCAYPRDGLIKRAVEVLEIGEPIIEDALAKEVAEGHLAQHDQPDVEGSCLVYLASLDASERGLARNLIALLNAPHPCPPIIVPKAIEWVEQKLGLRLASAQQEALELATRSKVMIITGGPGVGKTTLVNAIVKVFQAKKLNVVLCAPTGRAAKRMSETSNAKAQTIHRLLEMNAATGKFKHDRENPLEGDIFVVDETSMIDIVLAHQLVRAIPRSAALILVGDVDQLPSVGPGSVLRDIIDSGVMPVCTLTEVFRQAAQSAIISNSHRVNRGEMPLWPRVGDDVETDFYFVNAEEPEKGVELVLKLLRERIPGRFHFDPMDDVQVITPMQRGELGVRNLNLVIQEALNPSGEGVERYGWTFRPGDKVMQIVNDYQKDVFNGDIGRVMRIDHEEQSIQVRYDNRMVEYDFGELDELMLSYVITTHKSQGSEYPCVIIPMHSQHYMLLQRNLLYTAITRGKNLVVLVGTVKAIAIAVKRMEARRRVTTLAERLKIMSLEGEDGPRRSTFPTPLPL